MPRPPRPALYGRRDQRKGRRGQKQHRPQPGDRARTFQAFSLPAFDANLGGWVTSIIWCGGLNGYWNLAHVVGGVRGTEWPRSLLEGPASIHVVPRPAACSSWPTFERVVQREILFVQLEQLERFRHDFSDSRTADVPHSPAGPAFRRRPHGAGRPTPEPTAIADAYATSRPSRPGHDPGAAPTFSSARPDSPGRAANHRPRAANGNERFCTSRSALGEFHPARRSGRQPQKKPSLARRPFVEPAPALFRHGSRRHRATRPPRRQPDPNRCPNEGARSSAHSFARGRERGRRKGSQIGCATIVCWRRDCKMYDFSDYRRFSHFADFNCR